MDVDISFSLIGLCRRSRGILSFTSTHDEGGCHQKKYSHSGSSELGKFLKNPSESFQTTSTAMDEMKTAIFVPRLLGLGYEVVKFGCKLKWR